MGQKWTRFASLHPKKVCVPERGVERKARQWSTLSENFISTVHQKGGTWNILIENGKSFFPQLFRAILIFCISSSIFALYVLWFDSMIKLLLLVGDRWSYMWYIVYRVTTMIPHIKLLLVWLQKADYKVELFISIRRTPHRRCSWLLLFSLC